MDCETLIKVGKEGDGREKRKTREGPPPEGFVVLKLVLVIL
jgi:hypothetical protein